MVQTQTGRKGVGALPLRFEEQRSVGIGLSRVENSVVIVGVLQVARAGEDEGDVGVVLIVKHPRRFVCRFHPFRVDRHAIGVVHCFAVMRKLSALTRFLQAAQIELREEMIAVVGPAVHEVELLSFGAVGQSVVVLVVCVERLAVVPQHRRAPACRREQGALHIALDATMHIGIAVEQKDIRIFDLRLLVFHIDLSGERLIAVFHARRPFAHLDALHPRAGHVVQAEGLGEVAQGGDIFGQHLHVGAGESEEFDLSGTGGGVAVVDIDRGIVDKTLAEVAAGGAQEFVAGDGLVVLRETEGVEEALALGGHGGGAQIHLLGGCRRLVGEGVGLLSGSGGLGHLGVQRRHGGDEEKREEERRRVLHCVSVDGGG